jgi:hypothetical protein
VSPLAGVRGSAPCTSPRAVCARGIKELVGSMSGGLR